MDNIKEKIKYDLAVARVKEIKRFFVSLFLFFIVTAFLLFWHYNKTGVFTFNLERSFIIIIWALILVIKAIKLFLFNADWEKDMLNKELKKQQNGNN